MPRKASATNSTAKLSPINIRTTLDRRHRIEQLAKNSGRSLTQEVERLVDFALDFETRLGGPELVEAMSLIAQAAAQVLKQNPRGIANFKTRVQVVAAIRLAADWALPPALPQASEDFETLQANAADITRVMSHLVRDFDSTPLLQLARGWALHEQMLEYYRGVILDARTNRYSEDHAAQAVLDDIDAKLSESQRRALSVQQVAHEQTRVGESRARSALMDIFLARNTGNAGTSALD